MKKNNNLSDIVNLTGAKDLSVERSTSQGIFNTPAEALNFGGKVMTGVVVGTLTYAVVSPLAQAGMDAIKKSPLLGKAKHHGTELFHSAGGLVGDAWKGMKRAFGSTPAQA